MRGTKGPWSATTLPTVSLPGPDDSNPCPRRGRAQAAHRPTPTPGRLPDRHGEAVAPQPPDLQAPLVVGPSSPGGDTVPREMRRPLQPSPTSANRCQASSSDASTSTTRLPLALVMNPTSSAVQLPLQRQWMEGGSRSLGQLFDSARRDRDPGAAPVVAGVAHHGGGRTCAAAVAPGGVERWGW
jgi:hypothetical protein